MAEEDRVTPGAMGGSGAQTGFGGGPRRHGRDASEPPPPPAELAADPPIAPASRGLFERSWDFSLTVLTVALLGSLGLQSFLGTLYSWWMYRAIPGWEQAGGYAAFVTLMNLIAAPQVVVLVVVMGLCVPKRLFERRALVAVSAAMLVAGVAVALVSGSLTDGLAAYLALAALIQLAVVAMTVAGTRAPSYLTEGRLTKLGSGLLHLGFVLFAIVVAALQASPLMLPVFWISAALVTVGTALSFYARPVRRALRRPRGD